MVAGRNLLVWSLLYWCNNVVTSTSFVDCEDRRDARVSGADLELTVSSVLCGDDQSVYIEIQYPTYENNWFGIVFSDEMVGDALVYTAGKASETARELALYPYHNTGHGLSHVQYDDSVHMHWDEYEVQTDSTGIRVIYKTAMANTGFTMATESITIRYALGNPSDGHSLAYHRIRSDPLLLAFSADGPFSDTQTATATTTAASDTPETTETPLTTLESAVSLENLANCVNGNMATVANMDFAMSVSLLICGEEDAIYIDIHYPGYAGNWFGVVFGEDMIGDALVYTTGKQEDEVSRDLRLYTYTNTERSLDGVTYRPEIDWIEYETLVSDDGIRVVYTKPLSETAYSADTESIPLRMSIGNLKYGHALTYHAQRSETRVLPLSGSDAFVAQPAPAAAEREPDLTKIIAHGMLMWLSFAVLAPVGIFTSAFRVLLSNINVWYNVHRICLVAALGLSVVAFVLAVLYVHESSRGHFSGVHQVSGLVVLVVVFLQPINAYYRPSPPPGGWQFGVKPKKRVRWEYFHKSLGYCCPIAANAVVFLGLLLLGSDVLAFLHLGLWCGLLLVLYVGLFAYKRMKNQNIGYEDPNIELDRDYSISREQELVNRY